MPVADEVEDREDDDGIDYDSLTPDDVEEVSEYDAVQIDAEEASEKWASEVPDPGARQIVIDAYLANGDIDEAINTLGPDHAAKYAEAAQKVEAAISARIGKEVEEMGLTFGEMMEHMAEEDYGWYRQQALKGNWQAFRDLAQKGIELRLRLAKRSRILLTQALPGAG